LITSLFPDTPPSGLLPASILHPLRLVNSTLQPTLNTIKKALSSHTFIALDLYQSLIRVQNKWDPALNKCLSMTDANTSNDNVKELIAAITTPITTLRGLVSRSFPEFLVDIRTASGGPSTSSAISDSTHSTLTYLETLPVYEKTVEGLLNRSQSERSWLMGQKEAPSPAKNANEEGGIVNLYVGKCSNYIYM
jgi:exocyst complex protein 7